MVKLDEMQVETVMMRCHDINASSDQVDHSSQRLEPSRLAAYSDSITKWYFTRVYKVRP